MRRTLLIALFPLLLFSKEALPAYPDDVMVSNFSSISSSADRTTLFTSLVKELSIAISPKNLMPVETTGIFGFDMGIENTIVLINSNISEGESNYWQIADKGGNPPSFLWLPGIRVRKGLPFSFEIGGTFSYLAFSDQGVMSGYGKYTFNEGFFNLPDISFQLAYSGYISNDELDLGVLEWDISIGHTFPFGVIKGINVATFSPFAGFGRMIAHGRLKEIDFPIYEKAPSDSTTLEEEVPVSEFGGFESYDDDDDRIYLEDLALYKLFFGFGIVNGAFQFLASGEFTLDGIPSVNLRLGFAF